MRFEILDTIYSHSESEETREKKIADLKEMVNEFVKKHNPISVEWLQSSGGNEHAVSTALTAVIRY